MCDNKEKEGGEIIPPPLGIPNVPPPLIRSLIRKWLGGVLTAGKNIPPFGGHSHNRSHKGDNCLLEYPAP